MLASDVYQAIRIEKRENGAALATLNRLPLEARVERSTAIQRYMESMDTRPDELLKQTIPNSRRVL